MRVLPRAVYGLLVCLAFASASGARPAWSQIETLAAPGAWDLLYDDQRGLLYISTGEGEVLRYDPRWGVFRAPLRIVGRRLTDLTISPDRSSLVVVEAPPSGPVEPGWSGLHWVDLDSGVATPVDATPSWAGPPAFDAEFLPDGTVAVTSLPEPGDPGATTWLRRYDRSAGRFTPVQNFFGPADIAVSRNGARVLVSNTRNGGGRLYDAALSPLRIVISGWSTVFLQDEYAYATGVDQAFGDSIPIYVHRVSAAGSQKLWTMLHGRGTFALAGSARPIAMAFAPLGELMYSTWRGDAGAVVLVHRLADAPGPVDARWLGILDASFVYAADPADDRASGRIEILPDESRVYVAAPDGVRVYDAANFIDPDRDGIALDQDNCPSAYNPDQENTDGSGPGDACNDGADPDGDEYEIDNCPSVYNPDQANQDGSSFGDACNDHEDADGDDWADHRDACPEVYDPDQADQDGDGIGDVCDPFPTERDHVLGQVKLERDQALAELARVQAELAVCLDPPDADGDGVADVADACADTPAGEAVDADGCSRPQFCGAIELGGFRDALDCIRADWTGDARWPHRDCRPAWRPPGIRCVAAD